MNQRKKGARYEEAAASFLQNQGCVVLERNFYCRQGEIDLVAQDGAYLVFIEVKYRKDEQMGWAAEAVGPAKQQRIRHCARVYLYSRGLGEDIPCRFDVIAVTGSRIQWIKNAF